MEFAQKTESQTLAEWYLTESAGRFAARGFRQRLRDGQRIGQAFFNSLSEADARKLSGSLHDPFYGGMKETHAAIEFLTRK